MSQRLDDAATEAVVASKLQWYGFQLAFPLKISLCGAWECSPAIYRDPETAFLRVPSYFDHWLSGT